MKLEPWQQNILKDVDWLIWQAAIVETQLEQEIKQLQKYRKRISGMLDQREISALQRVALENLLDVINARNMRLYGGDQ